MCGLLLKFPLQLLSVFLACLQLLLQVSVAADRLFAGSEDEIVLLADLVKGKV